jgi:hypothetical protein
MKACLGARAPEMAEIELGLSLAFLPSVPVDPRRMLGVRHRRVDQQLHGRAAAREERLGEIERERRIDVPVVPLDKVADRAAENSSQARRRRRRAIDGRSVHAISSRR